MTFSKDLINYTLLYSEFDCKIINVCMETEKVKHVGTYKYKQLHTYGRNNPT